MNEFIHQLSYCVSLRHTSFLGRRNLHLVSEGECYAACVADRRMVDRHVPERLRELRNNLIALQQRILKDVNGMPLCFPRSALSLNGRNLHGGIFVGQPRQEELLDMVQDAELEEKAADKLLVNLSPYFRNGQTCSEEVRALT